MWDDIIVVWIIGLLLSGYLDDIDNTVVPTILGEYPPDVKRQHAMII